MKIQEAIEVLKVINQRYIDSRSCEKESEATETLIEAVEKVREVLKEVESLKNVSVYTTQGNALTFGNVNYVRYDDYEELKEKYNSLICVLRAGLEVFEDEE
jgi:hypothetical protein